MPAGPEAADGCNPHQRPIGVPASDDPLNRRHPRANVQCTLSYRPTTYTSLVGRAIVHHTYTPPR